VRDEPYSLPPRARVAAHWRAAFIKALEQPHRLEEVETERLLQQQLL
jgi:hypothetical protein